MTLDIKRKPGRPKKIVVEPDANRVIDIWFGSEPSKETTSDWPIDFTIKILGIIFLLVSIFYLLRRI
jgi:hypothetical protein